MSEPGRKKHKARKPVPVAAAVPEGTDPLVFFTTHKHRPGVVDLNELARGMSNAKGGLTKWKGPFTGRPILINELAPHLKATYGGTPQTTLRTLKQNLRAWWRLFDQYEDVAPVRMLEDITDVHGALVVRAKLAGSAVSGFLALVNRARTARHLPQLYWPTPQGNDAPSWLPDPKDVARLYHHLKRQVFATLDRWSAADAAAQIGPDWSGNFTSRPPRTPWSTEEMHATFRGIVRRCDHPCPDLTEAHAALGARDTKALQHRFTLVYGLYPCAADVKLFLYIFLLRTGWNAQVAIDLDISSDCVVPHPTSQAHHVVRSVKTRGNTEQVAIGLNKSQLSPGNLIQALVERTKPLHEHLKAELAKREALLQVSSTDVELRLEVAELRRQVKSPWLFVDAKRGARISSLNLNNYNGGGEGAVTFKTLLQDLNESLPVVQTVDNRITLSDFRDAYVAFAYERSGYNWLVAKLAAGHMGIKSLKTYLRHRQWKAHGEKKVGAFTEAMWDEIKTHRVVDAAILHARVQRGEITDAQRRRWLAGKDRTRCGVGCKDFQHPPKHIVPEHRPGDGCRVQRCTLCHHAVVLRDSLPHLARRKAELIFIKHHVSLTTWGQSSFEVELQSTDTTLGEFDAQEVQRQLAHWTAEIEAGRHVVFHFEGAYE